MAIQVTLPTTYAPNHLGYAVNTKKLCNCLFPPSRRKHPKHEQMSFPQWRDCRVCFYSLTTDYSAELSEEGTTPLHPTQKHAPHLFPNPNSEHVSKTKTHRAKSPNASLLN